MSADSWRRADEIFRRALELPRSDRQRFIEEAAAGDADLRRDVSELLAAESDSGGFLERSIEDLCDFPADEIFGEPPEASLRIGSPEDTDRAGERFGPYRLVRRIGRGGMASVYLAKRADGQFEQEVAIKLLRRGLDTDDIVGRFLVERQILSSLSHPNIARVFDGGATPDGLPYIVMEHVEGTPIVEWCDERGLTTRDRLRMFCDVARAVHHAHRSLVVHRDLKPSNILVDEEGNPKLLDFGIAKLLAGETDAEDTRTGVRVMTPAYASPELVRGDPITTGSDVYQLGILLSELLAGRLPYRVEALSPARAERLVTEATPARPSSLVTDSAARRRSSTERELSRELSGELDLIVLHALKSGPEERYASAEALADDVESYLRGEPIRARPDSLSYRAHKFVGRNRTAVAAAAALFVVLAGSVLVTSLQARRLAVERDRAVAEELRAQRVTGFLGDMFRLADPNAVRGDSVGAVELLDLGAERALRELASQPAVQSDVLSTIGDMYLRRGLPASALPVLEQAVELRRRHAPDAEAIVTDLRRLVQATRFDDRRRSLAYVKEAVSMAERELGPGHRLFALALIDLAQGLISGERMEAARERAVAILRDHPGDVREDLATALHFSALGGGMERFERLEEALEIRRELFGEDHTAVAAILNDMALKLEPFDPHAADTLLERAGEINVRIHGPTHHQSINILNNLAGRYRDRGDYAKAEPLYRELLERRREAYPENRLGIAYTLHGLGWSLTELGRAEEAEPMLRESVRIIETEGSAPYEVVRQMARSTLGRAIARQERFVEAEPLLVESYDWMARHDPNPLFVPFMLDRLIDLYEAWGDPGLAEDYRLRKSQFMERVELESAAAGSS